MALAVIGTGCSAPTPSRAPELGAAAADLEVERTWALNAHVIATSFTDLTGDVDALPIEDRDQALGGWGIEAATFGDRFTWLVGWEERTLQDDVDFVEVYGGSKLNLIRGGNWSPYLLGTVRYSHDLGLPTDPPSSTAGFFGWAAGGGVTYLLTERFFLEARVAYEGLFQDIDAGLGRELGIMGVVATIGAGFTF